ncbi:MAG: hypothetical protein IT350_06405 [Deltaproteobacteria bacterium]|nr:hypothetical protein [Deltaproteobacteria bacterium]
MNPRRERALLFFGSVATLFLELLLIRWISTEVRVFAYFKNLALIAAFLGLGLGFATAARPRGLPATIGAFVALVVFVSPPFVTDENLPARFLMRHLAFDDFFMWDMARSAPALTRVAAGIALLVILFGLIVVFFVPLGRLLGRLMENPHERLLRYSLNIGGSIAGVWLFSLVSFASLPPAAWLGLGALMLVPIAWPDRRETVAALAAGVVAVFCLTATHPAEPVTMNAAEGVTARSGDRPRVSWSPYQKLSLRTFRIPDEDEDLTFRVLEVNNTFYQFLFDLSPEFIRRHAAIFRADEKTLSYDFYNLPYRFVPNPRRVLIVGAGTGNDTAAALRNTSARIDAVEIDPDIFALGKELHPERPYANPRVTVVVDDARAHFQRTRETYDMILFGLLDAHTLSSNYSNISLDNYVYTVDSFRAAASHLAPGGLLVVSIGFSDWIGGRIAASLAEVFGNPPLAFRSVNPVYRGTTGAVLIGGTTKQFFDILSADETLRARVAGRMLDLPKDVTPTTDDWPYMWLRTRGIPTLHAIVTVVLAALSVIGVRAAMGGVARIDGSFFFLGAAFLLMEVHLISKMMLLFGSTWIVNAVVITGVLAMALAANGFVIRRRPANLSPYFAMLAVGLVVAWAVSPERWLGFGWLARGFAAGAFYTFPLFFAGVIIATKLDRCESVASALGSNLLGAILGGLAETLSFVTGIRALTLVALALYLAAWFFHARRKSAFA